MRNKKLTIKQLQEIDKRVEQAKKDKKKLTWKYFFKQKLFEVGIIPSALGAIVFLPYYLGWGLIKLFKINPVTSTLFCKNISESMEPILCDGINYSPANIWFLGELSIVLITGFIVINWGIASDRAERKAKEKNNLTHYQYKYGAKEAQELGDY